MSGIYIPGMEIPVDGNETITRIQSDGTVLDQCGHHLSLMVVPVPEHGRLIDADALIKVLKTKAKNPLNKETTPYSWAFAYECLADVVGDMPTIIPADHIGEANEMVADKEGEG